MVKGINNWVIHEKEKVMRFMNITCVSNKHHSLQEEFIESRLQLHET